MALQFVSMVSFAGIDTTVTGACPLTSVNRSPSGPRAHEPGLVLAQVLDLTTHNDITQQFLMSQGWFDSSEKVAEYGLYQLVGFNNSGKDCLAVFMAPGA
jgi:hypothetical protein